MNLPFKKIPGSRCLRSQLYVAMTGNEKLGTRNLLLVLIVQCRVRVIQPLLCLFCCGMSVERLQHNAVWATTTRVAHTAG